ncbi:TIR domain-containing protein [Algoriphagus lutimaris]|uniref:TIR domain-containing protein n=1 Tax=Algoriphagus lutimaris TaxID=613197 RepID=UPI00196B166C|nr:TIR domain-containing protein [Algoriphagus lutimaris]MBN3522024.1 TIR domain-containing protein [Algoriphagus lutimaris]
MFNAFISYSHSSDDKFAPALQDALHKFAKPWYKKRNLEIFRDESSLSASPHLWENIKKALDQSEYFILLASPLSENSKWVNKEVSYWIEHKSIDTILIALTGGEMLWDNHKNSFSDPDNNSLPPVLDDKFENEPFYIDLRQSKTEKDLSLDNPIFQKEILKLAAKLHGKAPNDLASEEVSLHRKWILVRNSFLSFLGIILITAVGLAIFANEKRKEAEKQTEIAKLKTLEAEKEKNEKEKSLEELKEFVSKGIGKEFEGGIIFSVDAERKNGYIAAKEDLEGEFDWKSAVEACEKYSITIDGKTYDDWFLPSKEILEELYTKKEEVGNFHESSDWSDEFYWSSTLEKGYEGNAWVTYLAMTKIRTSTYGINYRRGFVRPVRKFSSTN